MELKEIAQEQINQAQPLEVEYKRWTGQEWDDGMGGYEQKYFSEKIEIYPLQLWIEKVSAAGGTHPETHFIFAVNRELSTSDKIVHRDKEYDISEMLLNLASGKKCWLVKAISPGL